MNITRIPRSLPLIVFLLLGSTLLNNGHAQSESSIQLSLFSPLQIVKPTDSIIGGRLNLIYGKNRNVSGIDIGLVNHTTGNFMGFSYGAAHIVDGNATGFQVGFVNHVKGEFVGWQYSLVNTNRSTRGFQLGFVNHSGTMSGIQLGFINYADRVNKGIQIGLINIIREGGVLPILPIVNWSF